MTGDDTATKQSPPSSDSRDRSADGDWGGIIPEQQLRALVAYIKTLKSG
jgi:hypothetical protein